MLRLGDHLQFLQTLLIACAGFLPCWVMSSHLCPCQRWWTRRCPQPSKQQP